MASSGLFRSKDDRILAGVCGGIAKSMSTNAWLIRILFIIITALLGAGIGIYILAWILMKEEPDEITATPKEKAIPFKGEKKDDGASPIRPKDGAGIR